MDERGFAYTLDAVLALIPVMIILFGVSNLAASPESPSQIQFSQEAHDTLNLMVQYREGNGMSVLETMAFTLASGDNSATSIRRAGEIATTFLDKKLPAREYLLIEENQLNGEILAGKLDLEETDNLGTASRNCGNYTFRIYVK